MPEERAPASAPPPEPPPDLPRPRLGPVAARVFLTRYQRDDPSPAATLWRVARNVAAGGVEGVDRVVPADDETARAYYREMASLRFLPNSPCLMNAGRPLQQLAACYVLPVPDSLDGITAALSAQVKIQQSGGGTGFGFGRLRPAGALVRTTGGQASGPVSFIRAFDTMTDVVKQGGTRRGANMAVLPVTHPDVEAFTDAKRQPGQLRNFNLSVGVDDAFFERVATGELLDLVRPDTGEVVRRVSARALFDRIVDAAWSTGDPGLLFLDRIQASASNPVPGWGEIEATNPCGEVPLFPYEPCMLGSLNLEAFLDGPPGSASVSWDRLGASIDLAIRFLDDALAATRFPLPECEERSRALRRIGLGVMGFAELLARRGIAYDEPAAVDAAEALMAFVSRRALEASCALAETRGVFGAWSESVYCPENPHFCGEALRPRHAARTTIAPTGTIALAANLHGAGLEPFFSGGYTRYTQEALDAIAAGAAPDGVPAGSAFPMALPLIHELWEALAPPAPAPGELARRTLENGGRVRGLPGVPPEVARLLPTAHEISAEQHLRIQAAFQHHTDNAVSKTVNLPNAATRADVAAAFLLARHLQLKGVTVYRDGSKPSQVLSSACPDC